MQTAVGMSSLTLVPDDGSVLLVTGESHLLYDIRRQPPFLAAARPWRQAHALESWPEGEPGELAKWIFLQFLQAKTGQAASA